jgi:hypothetical protein
MDASEDKYRALRPIPTFPAIATKLLRALSHEDAQIPRAPESDSR